MVPFLDILIKKGTPPFEGLHETKEELECVKRIGADYIQGYYYGKPVCASDFEDQHLKTLISG